MTHFSGTADQLCRYPTVVKPMIMCDTCWHRWTKFWPILSLYGRSESQAAYIDCPVVEVLFCPAALRKQTRVACRECQATIGGRKHGPSRNISHHEIPYRTSTSTRHARGRNASCCCPPSLRTFRAQDGFWCIFTFAREAHCT